MKLGVIATASPASGGTFQYSLAMILALQTVPGLELTIYGDPKMADQPGIRTAVRQFHEPRWKQLADIATFRLPGTQADPFAAEDVLIAPTYSLSLLKTSRPFVYTLHDLQERYLPQNFTAAQKAWRALVHRLLTRRAAAILCESRYVKADIETFFQVHESRVAVIPSPPIALTSAGEPEETDLDMRKRLALPERYVFYPAQFWPHKNHLKLIAAFKEVAPQIPDLALVLTGKAQGKYDEVKKAVAQAGLEERVLMFGYVSQSDLFALFRLASMLVMPSLFESISIPVYEAFQAGIPVAASNILAIPEQIGDAGLLFDPHSSGDIARSILRIVADRKYAAQLADLGSARLSSMSLEKYGLQLHQLLASVAHR